MTGPTTNTVALDFGFVEEHELLRNAAVRFLSERFDRRALRALYDRTDAPDLQLYQDVAELGWPGLVAPAEHGGSEMGCLHAALLLEQIGYALFPAPCLEGLLASYVLSLCGGQQQQSRWLPAITTADIVATVALDPAAAEARLQARRRGTDWLLSGQLPHVSWGMQAGLLLVQAQDADGELRWFTLDAAQGAVSRRHLDTVDRTKPAARLHLDAAVGMPTAQSNGESATDPPDSMVARACALQAAENVGAAEALLIATRDYAIERQQFGRPIGSFQAVSHRIVNTMIDIENARSLSYAAAAAIDRRAPNRELLARMAKAASSEALHGASASAVQLHGGYGFTWECDVHFYFRRALATRAAHGDPADHRRALAEHLLDEPNNVADDGMQKTGE